MENNNEAAPVSGDRMQEILTPGEQRLINCAILCNPEAFNAVKIDYGKLAEFAGFKSTESARVNFGRAKRKLLENVGKGALPKPASPKKSPTKVTKATAAKDGSPKKPRGRKPKKGAEAQKTEETEESTPVAKTEEKEANGAKEEP